MVTADGGTTNTPSGLARRLASLATDTDAATPTEQVMPCSSWIVARSCSAISTGEPSRRVEPRTSRNASSSESTSTSGVIRRKFSITDAETVAKVSKSGETTTASRAQPAGPGHRHRRADAVLAGEVVGRQHHAAVAAADDDRDVLQVGPVADRDARRRRRPCRRAGSGSRRTPARRRHRRRSRAAPASGSAAVRRAGGAGWPGGGTRAGSATACSSSTRAAVAPGSRSSSEPGTRSAKTRTPCTASTSKPAPASSAVSSSWVKRRPARPGAAPRRSAGVEQRQGLLEVAGHRPGDHGGVPLGDQQAEQCPRAAAPGRACASAAAGSSTTSSTPWQSTTSALSGPTTSSRLARSPWRPVTVDAVLAGPAVERGQGVGAGVDDGDPVAELGRPGPRTRRCRRRCRGRRAGSPSPSTGLAAPAHTTAVRAAAAALAGGSLAWVDMARHA